MEDEYKIPMTASGAGRYFSEHIFSISPTNGEAKGMQAYWPERKDISNKEIEKLLTGLMLAFENSATSSYGVKRAKTSLTVTKSADGKLELSLGLGIFKLVDAEGKLKGEITEGIEIEIERKGV